MREVFSSNSASSTEGLVLTEEAFFIIVEKTIDPEEHRQLIFHRVLKFTREAVGIGPEAFMRYLEERDIQPCPELLTQIRQMKRQRALKNVKLGKAAIRLSAIGKLPYIFSISCRIHLLNYFPITYQI